MPISAFMRALCSEGAWGAFVFAGSLYLFERRGKHERIDPRRLVDLSSLLESIPEAALIADLEGRIVDANSAAAQLVGASQERLRGMRVEDVGKALLPEGSDGAVQEPVLSRALRGEVVRHQRRVVRNLQTGDNVELLVSANPIRNERGEVIGALLIARDVTELTELQRHMGDVDRHQAIGQMAAALAHDFNNVLNAIGQSAYLLELNQDKPASDRRPWLDMIQNSVRRGAEIISRVREYLRTGSGALEPVDVCAIIEEALELTRPLWEKAKVKVVTKLKPVPTVQANAADLRRVFTNLIINAIEAMPSGGRIVLTCEERDGRVVAMVADTGAGIPPEQQKKIFFPYFTTKPRGTGLGLSSAQKILLAQGGNIGFHSEPGKGTTFTINLPVLQQNGGDRQSAA
jgi:PAS domain S-box-containing protein